MKPCRKCGSVKPLADFHRASDMKDGHRNECKTCWQQICRARYQANRDRYIRRSQRWRENNPEKYEAWRRRNRDENRQRISKNNRKNYFLRTYGLTEEDLYFLSVAQNHRCAVCGLGHEAGLHIDHDHATGLIRGLLCGKCNKAIGLLKEDPVLFDAASRYLQRTQLPLGCGEKDRRPTRVRRRADNAPVPEEQ